MDFQQTQQQTPVNQQTSIIPVKPANKLPLFFLIFLIIVGFVSGIYYLTTFQNQPSSQPTIIPTKAILPSSTLSPNPTVNWKTYTDEKGIYTFKYPSDWYQNECGGAGITNTPVNDCGSDRILTFTVEEGGGNFDEYITKRGFKDYYDFIEKNIAITGSDYKYVSNNKEFIGVLKQGVSAPGLFYKGIWTQFPYKDKTYYVIYHKVTKDELDYLTIYNQILSTFTFLDQEIISCEKDDECAVELCGCVAKRKEFINPEKNICTVVCDKPKCVDNKCVLVK